jgi:ABC-2 type transport system ATP-binding protein
MRLLGRRRRAGVLAIAAAVVLLGAPAADARDAVVTSFDGTPIVTHLFSPTTPPANGRAPTVLVGPTNSSPGDTQPDADSGSGPGLATLRGAGYNVVTWDPRGFGTSGGIPQLDSPAYEGRDVQAIISWLALQPEAQLDRPGDPRVAMSGLSYGATIQYVAAALDRRIDAIMPDSGWHSLLSALFKDGAVKTSWLNALCTPSAPPALSGALLGAPGTQLGGALDPHLTTACVDGLAGGLSAADRRWFRAIGPGSLVDRIRAPTLILQGTPDTFFPLSEAIANFDALRAHGVVAKMIWYCGGHGACATPAGDPQYPVRQELAWLRRWLGRDATVDTGPRFEWIDDRGTWRFGPDYPLAAAGSVAAAGKGRLALSPFTSPKLGLTDLTTPDDHAASIRFSRPRRGADIVGTPTVRITYRGRADPARTFVYAQIVDATAKRVIGGEATPIPVVLDGRRHTIQRPLEAIAVHTVAGSSYVLQISSGGATYALQHSLGSISLSAARATLPIVNPRRSGRGAGIRSAVHAGRRPAARRLA